MNVALRPYRVSPVRKRYTDLTDPFTFGGGLLDEFLKLSEGGKHVENGSRYNSKVFPLNIHEGEKGYTLAVALPGVNKDEIDLSVEDGTLTISAKQGCEGQDTSREEDSKACSREYASQEWEPPCGARSLALPSDANVDSLDASLKNGVLTLQIAKLEEKRPRKVEIK